MISSISWIILIPCILRHASTPAFCAGLMLRKTTDCEGVSSMSTPSKLSTTARKPDFMRSSGVSRTRPW